VTGAGRGIGRAIAVALQRAGAEVVALDRDEAALDHLHSTTGCAIMRADLVADQPEAIAARLVEGHGLIELIVNNVGITTRARFRELTEADFDLVMAANVRGPLFVTRKLVDELVAAERPGSILFISSVHASRVRHFPHYSASKAAVSILTCELAHELGPLGIRVNAISPGWIDTGGDATAASRASEMIPLRRVGRPEDVAQVALSLLDDHVSGYVTGADVPVDGGLRLYSWLDAVEA
jgi:NAD(P)-dependent dehydrogenase (short-subunit alcohol dehydrogenase family)